MFLNEIYDGNLAYLYPALDKRLTSPGEHIFMAWPPRVLKIVHTQPAGRIGGHVLWLLNLIINHFLTAQWPWSTQLTIFLHLYTQKHARTDVSLQVFCSPKK